MAESKALPTEITFDFTRSADFRVVHANGVWGGAMPTQEVGMAFFVDRTPFPISMTQAIEDGRVGTEVARVQANERVEREIQIEVRISLSTARAMREWLGVHIHALEEAADAIRTRRADQEHDAPTSSST